METESKSSSEIDGIPGLVAIMAPNGKLHAANPQVSEYCGLSLEDLKDWGTNGTVHPADVPVIGPIFMSSMNTGEPYDYECRIRRFDGVYRWFNVRGLPFRESGSIVRWYVLLTDIDDRKRAEDALRESERNARLIVDTIPVGAALLSATGEMEVANEQMAEYFGKPLEELKRWATSDDVHPEDRARVRDSFRQSIEAGTDYKNEQRLRRADGVYRWFEVRRRPIRNTDGTLTGWNVLHIDIDERKRAEEELHERERQIRLIVESIPALAMVTDSVGRHEFTNQRVLDYYGKTFEEIRDWPIRPDLVHPDDLAHANEVVARTVAGGIPYQDEYRLRRHDGIYRWFEGRGLPYRDDGGQIQNWYVLLNDIDDRKRAEQALAASERNLQLIIDTTPAMIWSARPDGEADSINRHFLEYVGLTPEELQQSGWQKAVHPDDLGPLLSFWKQVRDAGTAGQTEARLRRHDGSYRWFLFQVQPLRDESGAIVKWYGVNTDIEERRVAEEALNKVRSELAHASRAMSLGVLTASIAHEVNQPLAGIATNAATCLRMLSTDPANLEGARATAQRTLRDAHRASEIIQRLRVMFARREPVIEPVDLNEAAREVLALSSSELRDSDIVVQMDFAAGIPDVIGDRVQLQQVILNLILNAADAMQRTEGPRELLIATTRENAQEVRLSVRDTGPGLDEATAARLFEAFYTTKSKGMGVGLSISRSIIESHAGRIWAETNNGAGATFAFTVPSAAN